MTSSIPSILRAIAVLINFILLGGENPIPLTSLQRIVSLKEIYQNCIFIEASSSSTPLDNQNSTSITVDYLFSPLPLKLHNSVRLGTILGNLILSYGFSLFVCFFVCVSVFHKRIRDHKPMCLCCDNGNGSQQGCCSCLFGSNKKPTIQRGRRGAADRADHYEFNGYNFGREESDDDADDQNGNDEQESSQDHDREPNPRVEVGGDAVVSYESTHSFSDTFIKDFSFPSRWIVVFLFILSGSIDAAVSLIVSKEINESTLHLIFAILPFVFILLFPILVFIFQLWRGFSKIDAKRTARPLPDRRNFPTRFFLFKFFQGELSFKKDEAPEFFEKFFVFTERMSNPKFIFFDVVCTLICAVFSGISKSNDDCNNILDPKVMAIVPTAFLALHSLDHILILFCSKTSSWSIYFSLFDKIFAFLLSVVTLIYGILIVSNEQSQSSLEAVEMIHAIVGVTISVGHLFFAFVVRKSPDDMLLVVENETSSSNDTNNNKKTRLHQKERRDVEEDEDEAELIIIQEEHDDEDEHPEEEENDEVPKRLSEKRTASVIKREHEKSSAIDKLLSQLNPSLSQTSFSPLRQKSFTMMEKDDQGDHAEVLMLKKQEKLKKREERRSRVLNDGEESPPKNNNKSPKVPSKRVAESLKKLRKDFEFI